MLHVRCSGSGEGGAFHHGAVLAVHGRICQRPCAGAQLGPEVPTPLQHMSNLVRMLVFARQW